MKTIFIRRKKTFCVGYTMQINDDESDEDIIDRFEEWCDDNIDQVERDQYMNGADISYTVDRTPCDDEPDILLNEEE